MAGKFVTLVSFLFVATAAAMTVPEKRQDPDPDQGSGPGMPTAVQATGVTPTAVTSCPEFQESFLSGSQVGQMTYFDATGTGACGFSQTEQTPLVAVSHCLFDAVAPGHPNNAPFCNKLITINFNGDGSSMTPVTIPVMDLCRGCGPSDIDLSLAAWNSVTSVAPSRFLNVTWEWA
ncbi:hypothetical protein BD410DRAFT_87545 [Rickenella mellea]|uniref:RlpA-like protein double-psi beta-barrel domain-containing protein n=1 Tax=Rickenella mellea TaxID=50990 RepID=A0A4Y7PJT7_9AGAM|nr:hypothetical protein BD410DRAFT_87545 [Rickenella mellea]